VSTGPRLEWSSDVDFTIDGVAYRSESYAGEAGRVSPDQMLLLKPPSEIEAYAALIAATGPRTIVELGIYKGGSTALLAQLAQPTKLVAIDLREDCPPLDRFIDAQGLRGSIVPCYGVDQTDVATLDAILLRELGDAPLDLVIDDASHLLPATRTSFTRLFPQVAPGGTYVIEDWAWGHQDFVMPPPRFQDVQPLSAFVCELAILAARRPGIIAEITIDAHKAVVRRGSRAVDPTSFDITEHLDAVGRAIVAGLAPVRTRRAEATG
jgi:predicted O-methyltransferase YrrM